MRPSSLRALNHCKRFGVAIFLRENKWQSSGLRWWKGQVSETSNRLARSSFLCRCGIALMTMPDIWIRQGGCHSVYKGMGRAHAVSILPVRHGSSGVRSIDFPHQSPDLLLVRVTVASWCVTSAPSLVSRTSSPKCRSPALRPQRMLPVCFPDANQTRRHARSPANRLRRVLETGSTPAPLRAVAPPAPRSRLRRARPSRQSPSAILFSRSSASAAGDGGNMNFNLAAIQTAFSTAPGNRCLSEASLCQKENMRAGGGRLGS